MKQILIATHGKMASGIRYTAELIVGKMDEITTIDAYVTPEDNVEKKFEEYFAQHENDRIFVFTDLMGGSVNQKLLRYSQKENVILITGTNLPVLMQVMMADDDVTEEEIQEFIDDAREELQMVDLGGGKKSTSEKNAEEDTAQGIENTAQISEDAASYAKKSAPKKALAPQSYDNSTAKITALRVDDRLIHGQVAMTWTKQLAVQGIVVANDEAANDNTQKMALKMAVPGGIKSLIKPVDEAIRILNNPKASRMRILVLTRTVKDEEELLTEGDYQLLLPEDEKIFAYLRTSDKEQWIVVANLSEDTVSTEGLAKYVSDKEDIKIANYKDRTGIKVDLRPYEAFMMRIR